MTDEELDIQVRGAMKVLDGEVPSGYFDGLPNQTLARLEDRSMDTTPSTGPHKSEALPPPIAAESVAPKKPLEEDSGLHDIRSLAQSTKQRLSRKSTTPPVDEDILASSSAGWKNVALPEPAKMISLPALEQLPTKKQIKEQIKAQKEKAAAPMPVAARPPTHLDESAPVAKAAPAASMSFGANITKQQKSGNKPLYIVVGIGLAAAAGGLIYVATQGGSKSAPVVAKADEPRAPVAPPVAPPPPVAAIAAPPPVDTTAPSGSAAVEAPPPVEVVATTPVAPKAVGKGVATKPGKMKVDSKPTDSKPEVQSKKPEAGKKEPPKEGEPDFNDLLKEAGVKDPTKAKPKLDKKSLSGGDFKAGMNSIASKASACYAGTQGTAIVKLTVAPSGAVSKASVSGPFAGTAVAACVEAAVRGASFPAWEGGPQSFGYSFLLSE